MKLALVLTAFAVLQGATTALHQFGRHGKAELCVPTKDMDAVLLPYADQSTKLNPHPGETPGFAFLIPASLVEKNIQPFYVNPNLDARRYTNSLSGTVSFLNPEDEKRFGPAMRARDTEDAWYMRGKCASPSVKKINGSDLFQVMCSPQGNYWGIWNRPPRSSEVMPKPNDLVVASCDLEKTQILPTSSRTTADCSRVVLYKDFMVDYRFQAQNARLIPQMDNFLFSKVRAWERNCRK